MIARWRDITATTATSFIRAAKNERYTPAAIQSTIRRRQNNDIDPDESPNVAQSPLMHMMAGISSRYQSSLDRQGSLDYDDLIWHAANLLEHRPDLVESLRGRWPFVLDEAQDSVRFSGDSTGHTDRAKRQLGARRRPKPGHRRTPSAAAHPRFFSKFIDRPDVVAKTLPNSGRSAPLIIGAANAMLNWTINQHPVPRGEARCLPPTGHPADPTGRRTAEPARQRGGDAHSRVSSSRRRKEIPAIARPGRGIHPPTTAAHHRHPGSDPPDRLRHCPHLDALNADYDNLLRGSGREREVAAAIHAVLAVLANPLDTKALNAAHNSLSELKESGPIYAVLPEEPEDSARFQALLRSVYRPESILFPREGEPIENLLPTGVASEEDIDRLERLAGFLRDNFDLRTLPIDDLTLALANVLFAPRSGSNAADDTTHELDLAIAYQIAGQLRQWREAQPEWRLPELVAQLQSVATGRRTLNVVRDDSDQPKPGRISLTTQHSGKGLEWDAVFLVGIDGMS